ncbi:hypothetical protein ACVWY3_002255 [Bradyrhizobium sp. USDA 4486]
MTMRTTEMTHVCECGHKGHVGVDEHDKIEPLAAQRSTA